MRLMTKWKQQLIINQRSETAPKKLKRRGEDVTLGSQDDLMPLSSL